MKLYYKIKQTPEFIFSYLTDMQKFVLVHPVITKIEKTGNETYLVYETLQIGFIPLSFTYPAIIDGRPLDNLVIMQATVMKLTKIEMIFKLQAEGEFTIIEENIKFKSSLPVSSIIKNIFKKHHRQLFRNIELL